MIEKLLSLFGSKKETEKETKTENEFKFRKHIETEFIDRLAYGEEWLAYMASEYRISEKCREIKEKWGVEATIGIMEIKFDNGDLDYIVLTFVW